MWLHLFWDDPVLAALTAPRRALPHILNAVIFSCVVEALPLLPKKETCDVSKINAPLKLRPY